MATESKLVGSADGVAVAKVKNGFEVGFGFDRQLVSLMHQVQGAEFSKNDDVWKVPKASEEALAKTVTDMRLEHNAIVKDRESILALAGASALERQGTHGTAKTISPKVGDFREAGKLYSGEIVNANARFAAQLTGFGKEDGAAFVTVHRVVELDKPVMKGDIVGIKYNEKGIGEVSDRSKWKSQEDRAADYQSTLGKEVDGVTVTERGDKIGVAFNINPVLMGRIKRVEGAVFSKEDKLWEIPAVNKEFALRAVGDMRQAFVADGKDVAAMKEFAESKMDGAKVQDAFTKDGQEHFGKVIAVSDLYVLQKGGMDIFKLHHRESLDQKSPEIDHNHRIKYTKGVGAVVDLDKQKEQSKALAR